MRKIWLLLLLVGIGALSVAYALVLRPIRLVGLQIRTHIACQSAVKGLRRYFEANGTYPVLLQEALPPEKTDWHLDAWDNELLYLSTGNSFILVSYGRDGQPDGTDYWDLRELGSYPTGHDICGAPDADEVVSDRGWHRLCEK